MNREIVNCGHFGRLINTCMRGSMPILTTHLLVSVLLFSQMENIKKSEGDFLVSEKKSNAQENCLSLAYAKGFQIFLLTQNNSASISALVGDRKSTRLNSSH